MKDKNKLRVFWSKRENDHLIQFPRSCDGSFIQGALFHKRWTWGNRDSLEHSIAEELDKRGYDLETLKFEIKKKAKLILVESLKC